MVTSRVVELPIAPTYQSSPRRRAMATDWLGSPLMARVSSHEAGIGLMKLLGVPEIRCNPLS